MSLTLAFQTMFVASCVLALVALYRQRPCTFIVAANQGLVLHALRGFSDNGRPEFMMYTPNWVYSSQQLRVAAAIFAIAIAMLAVCAFLPSKKRRFDPRTLPPVPLWALIGLGAYFLALTLSLRTVFSVRYADETQHVFEAPGGGVQCIMAAALLYEVCRRVWVGQWSAWRGLALFIGVFVATDLLKGQTGLTTAESLVAAMLLWGAKYTRAKAAMRAGALLLVLASVAIVMRTVRLDLHREGYSALETAQTQLLSSDEGAAHAEAGTSGPQFATHVLECVALYDAGRSRDWRSLTDPVVFTFEPAFLLKPLELQRPIDATWELGAHFIHLGGISVYGEAYWNGGYLGVVVFLSLILSVCYFCDSRYRSSPFWLVLLLNFAPVLLQGMNYGFSYEFRGVINGLLEFAVFRLILPKPSTLLPTEGGEEATRVPATSSPALAPPQ